MTFGLFIGILLLIFFFYYPQLILPFLMLLGVGFVVIIIIVLIYTSHQSNAQNYSNTIPAQSYPSQVSSGDYFVSPTVDPWSEDSSINNCVNHNATYAECKCIGDYIFSHYTEEQFKSWTNNNVTPQDVMSEGTYCSQTYGTANTPTAAY